MSSFSLLLFSLVSLTAWSYRYVPKFSTKPISTAASSISKSQFTPLASVLQSFDHFAENKLPWSPIGYKQWNWRGHKINYVDLGSENAVDNRPSLLLIHGFGASSYHWRYNIPVLARKYHVYAIDLLGFGLSDKPILEYTADIWRDQVVDFLDQVIDRKGTVVAGNSLGGFTALFASACEFAQQKDLISGCILLNSAGRFRLPESADPQKQESQWLKPILNLMKRVVIGASFIYTKQPARIAQVLRQVYPVDSSNVDDDLVESIRLPAQDPNAAEVFYRVVSRNGAGPELFVDDLLAKLDVPLMLLWGMKDPWIRPQAAEKIRSLRPNTEFVEVDAGHCPHDETPEPVNDAIDKFVESLVKSRSQQLAVVGN